MKIAFTIYAQLASLKNRRVPSRQNPYVTLPNRSAQAFQRAFLQQVPRWAQKAIGSLSQPLRAHVVVYYRDMRSDLDAALVYDLCQQAGVVRNDRYIRVKYEEAKIDKLNPRVEIEVEEI